MIKKKRYWLIEFVRMIEETGEFEAKIYPPHSDLLHIYSILILHKNSKTYTIARIYGKKIIFVGSLEDEELYDMVSSREGVIDWLKKYGK